MADDQEDRVAEDQPADKVDPVDYKYALKQLAVEMAGMAERAAVEIKGLRAQNLALSAKADAYETVRAVVRLLPREPQGMSEDFAWRLEQRAEQLREQAHGG